MQQEMLPLGKTNQVLFNNNLFMSKMNNKVLGIFLQNFFFFFYWKDHCDIGKPLLVVVRCFLNKFGAGEFFITRIRGVYPTRASNFKEDTVKPPTLPLTQPNITNHMSQKKVVQLD